jgi:hypothetical protein
MRAPTIPDARVNVSSDRKRIYITWGWLPGPCYTRGYPIEVGADGLDYCVFADPDEAADIRDQIAPGADLECFGSWEPRAIALSDLEQTA